MKARITAPLIKRYMGIQGEGYKIFKYHLEVPILEAIKLNEDKPKSVTRLKAGETYYLKSALSVSPYKTIVQVNVNPKLQEYGLFNYYSEYLPIGNQVELGFYFNCLKDISIKDLDYLLAITADDTNYGKWKTL